MLLSGEFVRKSSDFNVKTAGFYLPGMTHPSGIRIVLFGLKNGFLNGKPLKP